MDWRHQSACLREDPELFFPIGDAAPARHQEDAARRVCGRCHVREECLSWALRSGEDFGVLGGLTPAERRKVRQRLLV
jgi:WhiB family redox-sensing transcriptional regulator